MDIKYYYEETSMSLQTIADKLNIGLNKVWKYTKRNYSKEFRKARKVKNYSASKQGNKNPMFGKVGEEHHNFVGIVGDNKGYFMQLKPAWFTGRKHSKHVFVHHIVVAHHPIVIVTNCVDTDSCNSHDCDSCHYNDVVLIGFLLHIFSTLN